MDDAMSLNDAMSLDDAVTNAAAVLRAGGAAVFPTDTVYGLGVAVGSCASPQQLFAIKRRDEACMTWTLTARTSPHGHVPRPRSIGRVR